MSRLQQLEELSGALPGLNEKNQQRQLAAQNVQFQQELQGGAPQAPAGAMAAQQVATQGQTALAGRQQLAQQQGQVGALQQQEQGRVAQEQYNQQALAQQKQLQDQELAQNARLTKEQLDSRKDIQEKDLASAKRLQKLGIDRDNNLKLTTLTQSEDLNKLGDDIKGKLFDSRMNFERDELGRRFTNDRQLADYVKANAKTDEEYMSRMQDIQQAQQEEIKMLSALYDSLTNEANRQSALSETKKNIEVERKIATLRDKIQKEMQKKKNAAANKAAAWQAGGTIVGAAVGSMAGSPAAGAAIGGALGTMASNA